MDTLTLGFIGAGNMATALIRGLLAAGQASPERIVASDPSAERLARLSNEFSVRTTSDNEDVMRTSQVVVVAVKPQVVDVILADLAAGDRGDRLIISVCAGVPLAKYSAALPEGARLIRAMPNTPVVVRAGATALAAGAHATERDIELAVRLFDSVGTTAVLNESLLDAITGLSGSGPAYVMLMVEALADGGVKMGLDRKTAQAFATQTLYGAAKLLLESGSHPGQLKDAVTSPGGTTIAGLHALEAHGLRHALMAAVQAATERSIELGQGPCK